MSSHLDASSLCAMNDCPVMLDVAHWCGSFAREALFDLRPKRVHVVWQLVCVMKSPNSARPFELNPGIFQAKLQSDVNRKYGPIGRIRQFCFCTYSQGLQTRSPSVLPFVAAPTCFSSVDTSCLFSANLLPFTSSTPPLQTQHAHALARHNSRRTPFYSLGPCLLTSSPQVVGAKYSGEGLPIPEDCPAAIGGLMKSCWSNLPSNRPSFDKICDSLADAQGWLEEDSDVGAASPLGQEQQQGRTTTMIVSPLQEVEESGLEVDESVGSSGSGGSGGLTPSGRIVCLVCDGNTRISQQWPCALR